VLGGKYSFLDFDDADSKVIEAAVETLKEKYHISKIDAFAVPHHGSKYHDLDAIFHLNPARAIIAVNPKNQHGHPASEQVRALVEKLGEKNVLFTGKEQNIDITPEGIKYAQWDASNPDAIDLFIEKDSADYLYLKKKAITAKERSSSSSVGPLDSAEEQVMKKKMEEIKKDYEQPTRWRELDILRKYLDEDSLKAMEDALKHIKVKDIK